MYHLQVFSVSSLVIAHTCPFNMCSYQMNSMAVQALQLMGRVPAAVDLGVVVPQLALLGAWDGVVSLPLQVLLPTAMDTSQVACCSMSNMRPGTATMCMYA